MNMRQICSKLELGQHTTIRGLLIDLAIMLSF
jgi:hypothetical protein